MILLGKFEPCWTCTNKNNNYVFIEKIKNHNMKDITSMLRQGHTFDLSSKGNINENKELVMPSNESMRDFDSL